MNYNFEDYIYLEYDRDYVIKKFKEYFGEQNIEQFRSATIDYIEMPANMVQQLINTDQLVLCMLRKSTFENEKDFNGWRGVTSLDTSIRNRRIRHWSVPKSFFRIIPQKELESGNYFKKKRIKKLTNTKIEI